MYQRLLNPSSDQSYFLFGPRGTGKSCFVSTTYKKALFFDLLDSDIYLKLTAAPHRLADSIPSGFKGWVVIDEIQKVPDLLIDSKP